VRGKVLDIFGHSLFATPQDVLARGFRELCEHARDGRIRFVVERFALDDVAQAWSRQAAGSPGGKVVVTLS
jgi:hypothetical protein